LKFEVEAREGVWDVGLRLKSGERRKERKGRKEGKEMNVEQMNKKKRRRKKKMIMSGVFFSFFHD